MVIAQDAPARRLAQWRDTLDRAAGLDNWGQMVEACTEYEKVRSADAKWNTWIIVLLRW